MLISDLVEFKIQGNVFEIFGRTFGIDFERWIGSKFDDSMDDWNLN